MGYVGAVLHTQPALVTLDAMKTSIVLMCMNFRITILEMKIVMTRISAALMNAIIIFIITIM